MDPDRQGLVPAVLERGRRFQDYIEWALDAPMFLVLRGARIVPNTGQTFRDYFANGFEGERSTMNDWLTHLNTMFPEVRLKKTLEVRGADSLPRDLFAALPALWTGLLYDPQALDEADALVQTFGVSDLEAVRARIAAEALLATWQRGTVGDVVEKVVAIARGGLSRRARVDDRGVDESTFLVPLERLIASRRAPADLLIAASTEPRWSDRLKPVLL